MKALQSKTLVLVAAAFAVVAPSTSLAGIITGSVLNISGDALVGATQLTFQCDQPSGGGIDPACATAPAGTGDFSVGNSTGSFAQYNSTLGLIKSINNATQPLNAPFLLPNFITFTTVSPTGDNIQIDLTFIPLGNDTPSTTCAGLNHCTPQNNLLITPTNPLGLSAFNLDLLSNGTSASFGVFGTARDTKDGSTANLAGSFSTTFVGLNPQQALAAALAPGGSPQSYQSNLNLTVVASPEPASFLLAGLGLVALGVIRHKKAA